MFRADIIEPSGMSIAIRNDIETIEEAEMWCEGFISGLGYSGLPFPEVYSWEVWDDDFITAEPESSWSRKKGYWRKKTNSAY